MGHPNEEWTYEAIARGIQRQGRLESVRCRNQGAGLSRDKTSHQGGIGQERLDVEQDWPCCLQKDEQKREKGLQRDPKVDHGRAESPEEARHHWLVQCKERDTSLQGSQENLRSLSTFRFFVPCTFLYLALFTCTPLVNLLLHSQCTRFCLPSRFFVHLHFAFKLVQIQMF